MDNQPRPPKLSLVYAARNDDYMGNFCWRLTTTLDYLAHNLRQINRLDDVEVVIADWGSETPLHTVLPLSQTARQIVRHVLVPPDLARQAQKDSEFAIVIAQNAAIRRCRGEYVGQADSDMLFTRELIGAVLDGLDGRRPIGAPPDRALIYTKRRHIPWRYVATSPPLHELDWFIRRWGRLLPVERFLGFEFAGPGFMIMHRKLWEECRGYDERLIYRGWIEIDLGLRVRRQYPLINLQKIGLTAFHLEHFPTRQGNQLGRKSNPTNWNNAFRPNDENWGLGNQRLEIFTYPRQAELRGSPARPRVRERGERAGSPRSAQPARLAAQPVHIHARLRANILRVILNRLWYTIQYPFGLALLLTQRAFFHLGVIWRLVRGKPIRQWPAVVKNWWAERQQRQ